MTKKFTAYEKNELNVCNGIYHSRLYKPQRDLTVLLKHKSQKSIIFYVN
jgi:hypothetical protein